MKKYKVVIAKVTEDETVLMPDDAIFIGIKDYGNIFIYIIYLIPIILNPHA